MRYIYVIECAADGSYSVYVPDLLGCTIAGNSIDEVKQNIKDAVDSYVDSLRENNEPIPQPSSTTDVVEVA